MLVISCTLIFFFFASHGNVCTFLSLSFMKYNVLKTLCDDVIIFSGPVFGLSGVCCVCVPDFQVDGC